MRLVPAVLGAGFLGLPLVAQSARCVVTPYGRTCGPLLEGSVRLDGQDRRVTLSLANGYRNTFGFSVFGARSIETRIPGSDCYLLTDPVLLLPFATDARGAAQRTFSMPYEVSLLAFAQDVTFVRDPQGRLDFSSSNGVRMGPWFPIRFLEEDFTTKAGHDPSLGNAAWGGGFLRPAKLGGSGILGEFDATDGKDLGQKDSQGRDIWQWDTDRIVIPAGRTLHGKAVTVTNGVLEFTRFEIRANEHVQFVGSRVPRIEATGRIRIDGALSIPVPKPPTKPVDPRRGIFGGKGGPGAASGGQGGDVPAWPGGSIHGRDGSDLLVPKGHPRAGQAKGTGGQGSSAHPPSGLVKDLVWIVDTGVKLFVSGVAAGGGGGGSYLAGKAGQALKTTQRRPFWPYVPGEFGKPAPGGKAFPVLPLVATLSSVEQFSVGGSGGGGAGMHALYTVDERRIAWSPGAGGAGGGSVLILQAGGDLIVPDKGQILVRGGDSNDQPHNNTLPPVHAAGGAGSGGTVLAQCGGLPVLTGEVNVLGGTGGQLVEKTLLWTSSVGGDGGAGYIRVEADPAPNWIGLVGFQPPATQENAGRLRALDHDPVTAGGSRWYETGFLPTAYHYYVIRAKVDGKSVVLSDNPLVSPVAAVPGQPVVFYLQGGTVRQGRLQGDPTPWFEGRIDPINDSPNRGNGFRFLIRLDRTRTSSGNGPIEVDSVRVFFNC